MSETSKALTNSQWDALTAEERSVLWQYSPGCHPQDRAPNLGVENLGPVIVCTSPHCRPPDGTKCPGYHLWPKPESVFSKSYAAWQAWTKAAVGHEARMTLASRQRQQAAAASRAQGDPEFRLPSWAEKLLEAEAAAAAMRAEHNDAEAARRTPYWGPEED